MPNQIYIHPETPINGVCNNHAALPPTDGLFVGHRFINEELEILIGHKVGNDYRIATTICREDAQMLSERLAILLNQVAHGLEPHYANPTTFPFPHPAQYPNGEDAKNQSGHG